MSHCGFCVASLFTDPRVVKPEKRKKKRVMVPLRILEVAVTQCERFLSEREHEDIDRLDEVMGLMHCMLVNVLSFALTTVLSVFVCICFVFWYSSPERKQPSWA